MDWPVFLLLAILVIACCRLEERLDKLLQRALCLESRQLDQPPPRGLQRSRAFDHTCRSA
jgi:hypothetical protein